MPSEFGKHLLKTPDEFAAKVKARAIIKKLRIHDPREISIEDIAWIQGAHVIEDGLQGCDARLVYTPGVKPAILRVKKTLSPPGRKRFAIAHELGHLELQHRPGQPTECAEKEFQAWYKGQSWQEIEANMFGAELLMPESLFVPRLERTVPSFELIESTADEFQTTLTATAIRYIDLCGEQCAVVCSTAGKISWFRGSPDFHYWITPGRALSTNTYAVDFFEEGAVSQRMEDVRKDAWIDNASSRDTIKEQSRALFSYNSVLTLLWIP